MDEQQLRALRRKHLMVMIRDLERDLQKALLEKEQLMRAYQYGLERGPQDADNYAELLCGFPEQPMRYNHTEHYANLEYPDPAQTAFQPQYPLQYPQQPCAQYQQQFAGQEISGQDIVPQPQMWCYGAPRPNY